MLNRLTSYAGYDGYAQNYIYNAQSMMSAKETKGNPNRQTMEEIVSGKKEEPSSSDDDPDPADWVKTSYTYDVTAAYYEVLTETTNGVTTAYDYGVERLSSYTGASAWNTIKTQYVYDGRGSVAQELTYNDSWYTFGGFLARKGVNSYTYTPFGEPLTGEGSGFRFNGEYYDSATGMVNLRARQYEPSVMRFSQRDLLKGDQSASLSLNRYLYCENDSVNFVDPSGRSIADLWNKAKATVSNVATRVATTVSNAAKTVATTVTNAVKTVATTVSKAATYVATTVSDAAKYTATTVSNSVKQAATVVKSGAINAAAKITTAATTLAKNVKTTVSNARTSVLNWYDRNEETINKCLTTAAIVAAAAVMVVGTIASLGTLPAIAGIAFAGTALATAAPIITTIGL